MAFLIFFVGIETRITIIMMYRFQIIVVIKKRCVNHLLPKSNSMFEHSRESADSADSIDRWNLSPRPRGGLLSCALINGRSKRRLTFKFLKKK